MSTPVNTPKHSLYEAVLARISLGAVPIDGIYWFDPKAAVRADTLKQTKARATERPARESPAGATERPARESPAGAGAVDAACSPDSLSLGKSS
jgi:hypothetical protein